ncbi:alginate lyase-domain-containing protein [Fimicolochytrium jonesii]|uniref:alginate lyase-domain-containing protein n=1 Tax=Fimicolochytrium jonesii TaxID=1396493 RepID=UPI0022FE8187|nr:alginate lyase-domain-containing protein [Fimicolochytrium jonesii]KAI8825208.1 alginate lyase-domain-containing protein [Fimicolochytrium jonesii]
MPQPTPRLLIPLLLLLLLLPHPPTQGSTYPLPLLPDSLTTNYISARDLYRNRLLYLSGEGSDLNPAINHVVRLAEGWIADPTTYTVMNKMTHSTTDNNTTARIAPSGDPHDYFSLAKYYWPDPATPFGLPYIPRPGQINPSSTSLPNDRASLDAVIESVWTGALAWFWTRDERFSGMAGERLRVWFVEEGTRMNAAVGLEWDNWVVGRSSVGGGNGTVGGRNGTVGVGGNNLTDLATGMDLTFTSLHLLLDAILLLSPTSSITPLLPALTTWFTTYHSWLLTSPRAVAEQSQPSIRGLNTDIQHLALLLFLNRTAEADTYVRNTTIPRVTGAIGPDGRVASALTSGGADTWQNSVSYLSSLFTLGLLTLNNPPLPSLFSVTTTDNRSIRGALDFLLPYALANGTGWPTGPNETFSVGAQFWGMVGVAWVVWGEGRYRDAVVRGQGGGRWETARLWMPYGAFELRAESSGVVGRGEGVYGRWVLMIFGIGCGVWWM